MRVEEGRVAPAAKGRPASRAGEPASAAGYPTVKGGRSGADGRRASAGRRAEGTAAALSFFSRGRVGRVSRRERPHLASARQAWFQAACARTARMAARLVSRLAVVQATSQRPCDPGARSPAGKMGQRYCPNSGNLPDFNRSSKRPFGRGLCFSCVSRRRAATKCRNRRGARIFPPRGWAVPGARRAPASRPRAGRGAVPERSCPNPALDLLALTLLLWKRPWR